MTVYLKVGHEYRGITQSHIDKVALRIWKRRLGNGYKVGQSCPKEIKERLFKTSELE